MRDHQRSPAAVLKTFFYLYSKSEEVRLFQNPFEVVVASCLDELQLEVIELQANDLLRDKCKEGAVVVIESTLSIVNHGEAVSCVSAV
ncbi:hypothetical protein TNIN_133151 [Trichonephila inaurata madagascariensis]|uniref:Uncharacterized protein n=1 Tax=Trichonephila inaurata madagascariensis TaxID=2747483 RepID=A0A8X7BYF8_9ARAC|nr:hypothetical protein TNIN_133151 [Trichonephila inaurata madagascariensis]